MNNKAQKIPCSWKLLCDFWACIWFHSYKICRMFAIVFVTLAYEGSSGSFCSILMNYKFYIAIILFLVSFLLKKIIKIKSVSELEDELLEIKNYCFQDAIARIKGEITRKLEKEKPVDFSDYWHDLLAVIAKIYGFTNHERISIFAFIENLDNKVVMLGRYSKNKFLNLKGRGYHSTEQGSIAKALKSSQDFNFKDDFSSDEKKFNRELLEKENMSEDDIKKLKMRAKTIGSFVLHDAKEIDQIAVLVLESQDSKSKVLTKDVALSIYTEFKKGLEEMIYFQENLKLMPLSGVDENLEDENVI